MPQYLVAIDIPGNYDPSPEDEAMVREIHALNQEMIAAGVRKCGRSPTVRWSSPTETKEHVGRLSILKTATLNEALAWARKGAKACHGPVEVRPIFQKPAARQS